MGMVGMEADVLGCASNQSAVECHVIRHNYGGKCGEFLPPRVLFSAASGPLCRSRKETSLSVLWASEWFMLQHNYQWTCCTHCDVSSSLSWNVYTCSLSDPISPLAACFCQVECSISHWNVAAYVQLAWLLSPVNPQLYSTLT